MKKILFISLAIMLMTKTAIAATDEPQLLDKYQEWSAYSFNDQGKKSCFMSSQPQRQEGKFTKRGKVFMFITHWPGEKTMNVVSLAAGYPYKEGSKVTVTIDGKDFSMSILKDEMAWTADQASDDALTAAIRKGSKMTVKGTSKRGTLTTDTYSLDGSADAYDAISRECKV